MNNDSMVSVLIAFIGAYFLFVVIIVALFIISFWKIYEKAGKPGWAAIIPIYNLIVLLEVVGKPTWWIILYIIPCVNIIPMIIVNLELARVFGKSSGFGIGLILLPIIFIPMLGFGDARYTAPSNIGNL